ncbi:MAG: hypothetical protein WDA20_13330 [Desulfuromonadales bacterium]
MNQMALEKQITRLQKEIRLGGSEVETRLLELRAEVDRVRLEMSAVKLFLGAAYPAFNEQFPQILARVVAEVNPEFE